MATFNEFQRELQKRGIDPQNAYMFTLIYERLIETQKQVQDCAAAVLALANTTQGFVNLHETTQKQVMHLARGTREDDAQVESVAYDPDENKH